MKCIISSFFSIVLSFCLLLPSSQIRADELQQAITVTGVVADSEGPLPGVNVVLKGTSTGTVTDVNGRYSIDVPNRTAVLLFTYMGFVSKEMVVGAQSVINVEMVEDSQLLEEVVIVGYGTMRRSDVTSAISTVSQKDFNKQQAFRSTDALQGRVAGVQVTNTGGDPFSPVKIRIRGTNSINRGNDPLYVTNGVVGGGMPAVEDIESIEVLKDASATALYGSRGANGVILITTKKGTAGKTTITVDTYWTSQSPAKLYDKLDAASFCEAYNYTMDSKVFSNATIAEWRAKGGGDWQREVLSNSWLKRHRLNASGGTEKVRFYTTVSYSKNEAMIRDRNSESLGFSNRLDAELFKNVRLEWTAGISRNKSRNDGDNLRGGAGSMLFSAIINAPVARLVNEDGSYVALPEYGPNENNFMASLYEQDSWGQSISGSSNMALVWDIIPGLTATYRLNAGYSASRSHEYRSRNNRLGSPPTTGGSDSEGISYFQNLVLNYNKSLDMHNFGLTGVVESYKYEGENANYGGREFEVDLLRYWGMGMGDVLSSSVGYGNESLLSYVGRINYNYANKYVLTATLRYDGSSKFADENKWGAFPSASVAWRVSEEDFLKNTGIFHDLKIRASWGITGSQAVDQYQTISQLGSGNGVYFESINRVPSYIPRVINTQLKWESTTQLDVGLDFGVLDNRLSGSLDYYSKETNDLLMQEPLPGYLGGELVWRNKGKMSNKGVELALRYIAISNSDLTWEMSGNIARNVNKIVSLGQDVPIYINGAVGNGDGLDMAQSNVLMSGYPMGSIFGYKVDGIWKDSEAAEAAKYGASPGDLKYVDIGGATYKDENGNDMPYQWYEDGFAGDGKIDANDRTIIGCGTPKFSWGFNTSVYYKNFDVNVMLLGVQGAQMLNVVYAAASSARQGRSTSITLAEAWVNSYAPGVENPKFPNPQSSYSLNKQINTSFWVQDASFARLKNLSIGYTFNRNMLKYGSVRAYVSAQNLLTLTKYKGLDPESTSSTGSDNRDRGTGLDSGANPTPRCLTLGAQFTF